jgi:hypothetical protein
MHKNMLDLYPIMHHYNNKHPLSTNLQSGLKYTQVLFQIRENFQNMPIYTQASSYQSARCCNETIVNIKPKPYHC